MNYYSSSALLLFILSCIIGCITCQDRTVYVNFDQDVAITNTNETVRYQFIISPGKEFIFVDVLPFAAPDFNLKLHLLNAQNPFPSSSYQQSGYTGLVYFQLSQTPKSRWNTAITYKYFKLADSYDANSLIMGLFDTNTLSYKPFTADTCVNDVATKQVTQPTNSILDLTESVNTIGIFVKNTQQQNPQTSGTKPVPQPPTSSSSSVVSTTMLFIFMIALLCW